MAHDEELPDETLPTGAGEADATLPSRTQADPDAQATIPAEDRPEAIQAEIPGVEIDRILGGGGMGLVYHGRQTLLKREVAIKVLKPKWVDSAEFQKRFRREAQILADVRHPNIVACYHADTLSSGSCYLVMEFVGGPDLRQWVSEHGPLSVPMSLIVCRELALALQHANRSEIIHRDVKPDNVLLAPLPSSGADDEVPFEVKLADLGLARYTSAGDTDQSMMTAPGAVMGTPATMSPEQYNDPDSVDFRTDIYGIGCILFFTLTGELAFRESTIGTILLKKMEQPLGPDPSRLDASVPRDVARFVQRLMARDPDDRPASYAELLGECDALLHKYPSGSQATTHEASSSSRRPLMAIAVVAVVVATVAHFLSRGGEDEPPETEAEGRPVPVVPVVAVNRAPTIAGASERTVVEGRRIELEAEVVDADGDELEVTWMQTGGPPVDLEHAASGASFVAPAYVPATAQNFADNELAFALDATDGEESETATFTYRVVPAPLPAGEERWLFHNPTKSGLPPEWVKGPGTGWQFRFGIDDFVEGVRARATERSKNQRVYLDYGRVPSGTWQLEGRMWLIPEYERFGDESSPFDLCDWAALRVEFGDVACGVVLDSTSEAPAARCTAFRRAEDGLWDIAGGKLGHADIADGGREHVRVLADWDGTALRISSGALSHRYEPPAGVRPLRIALETRMGRAGFDEFVLRRPR